jgi:hypothetical protein
VLTVPPIADPQLPSLSLDMAADTVALGERVPFTLTLSNGAPDPAEDGVVEGMGSLGVFDIYDISQNGLSWTSGLALAADIAGLALPVVAGGGAAVRAFV